MFAVKTAESNYILDMKKISTRSISLTALALAGVSLLGSNLYFASGESSNINGCINKKTQILRIVAKCSAAETPISWPKSAAPSQATSELGFHQVTDGSGKVLGNLIGSTIFETIVLIGKSKVSYNDINGTANSAFESALYLKADCTSTPHQITDGFTNRFTLANPYIDGDVILGLGRQRFAAISTAKPIKKFPSELFFINNDDGKAVCQSVGFRNKGEVEGAIEVQELKIIEGIPMKVPTPLTIN